MGVNTIFNKANLGVEFSFDGEIPESLIEWSKAVIPDNLMYYVWGKIMVYGSHQFLKRRNSRWVKGRGISTFLKFVPVNCVTELGRWNINRLVKEI